MVVTLSSILYHISYYITINSTNPTRLIKLNKYTEETHMFPTTYLNSKNLWKPQNFVTNLVTTSHLNLYWNTNVFDEGIGGCPPPCLES